MCLVAAKMLFSSPLRGANSTPLNPLPGY